MGANFAFAGICTLKRVYTFLLVYYASSDFLFVYIANNASNANAVYRQSTRYNSCFTEESWASIGLEFGVQWVGAFTAT